MLERPNAFAAFWEAAQKSEQNLRLIGRLMADAQIEGSDAINPDHYKSHPSGVECITIAEHMNFNLGNALKYIWRAGQKGDAVEDLEKARWYLEREIARSMNMAREEHSSKSHVEPPQRGESQDLEHQK